MKIAITTMPPEINYGGILQNYALQEVLRRLGHQPVTLDCRMPPPGLCAIWIGSALKFVHRYLMGNHNVKRIRVWSELERSTVLAGNRAFVAANLELSPPIGTPGSLPVDPAEFGAFIAGSDQIWRPEYSADPGFYFLNFLPENYSGLRIAYAASFGVATSPFSARQAAEFGVLLRRFDAVSVREKSGIAICRDTLGVDAELMPDPTLLLESGDYRRFVRDFPGNDGKYVFSYLLDESPEKSALEKSAEKTFGLPVRKILAFDNIKSFFLHGETVPGVDEWLSLIANAEYVLTDSFHGMVFSIIFGKPFAIIPNQLRGTDRMATLLEEMHLENRVPQAGKLPEPEYDFRAVGARLATLRRRGTGFLLRALAAGSPRPGNTAN